MSVQLAIHFLTSSLLCALKENDLCKIINVIESVDIVAFVFITNILFIARALDGLASS